MKKSKAAGLVAYIVMVVYLSSCIADLLIPDMCGLEYSEGKVKEKFRCNWKIPQPSEWENTPHLKP